MQCILDTVHGAMDGRTTDMEVLHGSDIWMGRRVDGDMDGTTLTLHCPTLARGLVRHGHGINVIGVGHGNATCGRITRISGKTTEPWAGPSAGNAPFVFSEVKGPHGIPIICSVAKNG